MVNTSLKELKRYLTGFDQVVKERTTATAITEGTWGFEHTKACFRDEIIPFIKNLKDIFNNFNRYLVEELADVQKVFYQMEQAVEQHRLESRTFEVKMNQVLGENERLLTQAIDKDIVQTVMNLSVNASGETVPECQKCLELETELLKKKDFNLKKEDNSDCCLNIGRLANAESVRKLCFTTYVLLTKRIPVNPGDPNSNIPSLLSEMNAGTDKSKITRKQSKASKHGHENQKSAKPKPQKTKALANFHLQGPFLQFPKVIYNLKE
ncbi:hypothetical protein Tco_1167398 [Tanacetum coccineum]